MLSMFFRKIKKKQQPNKGGNALIRLVYETHLKDVVVCAFR